MNVAELYEKNGDVENAEAMYERALKKYKYSKKVWSAFQVFRIKHRNFTGAKDLLARSLQSLSRHKHIEVIEKYALAEYDFGSADRGRTLFEELITNYPKRTDLWNVYVDKEIKQGNFAEARHLFQRMTTIKMSPRNMKTIFKKYLSFEIVHGDDKTQELVKQKAKAYVDNIQ
jgi:rRNA biogenesis protein RRP5